LAPSAPLIIREEKLCPIRGGWHHATNADLCLAQTVSIDHRDLIMMVTWEFAEFLP